MILPALYHWSPKVRRRAIHRGGLRPGCRSTTASGSLPYVCLSPTPSSAWTLSGATGWTEVEAWDLWQVRLGDGDQIVVRPEFDAVIREIKVHNVIPPDRLWWVAEREA